MTIPTADTDFLGGLALLATFLGVWGGSGLWRRRRG